MKTRRTITTLAAVLAMLTLLAGVTGCTAVNLALDLMGEPGVQDAGIYIDGDTLTCKLVVGKDAAGPLPRDMERYAAMAAKAYPGKAVIVNVVQDGGGVLLDSYRLD